LTPIDVAALPFTQWLVSMIAGHHWLLGVPALIFIGVCVVARRQDRALALATYLVERGRYEPAPAEEIEGLIKHAESLGREELALAELARVRQLYGHAGVRKGHILWVLQRLDGAIADDVVPPPFSS
jgi:hypothetical protein